MTVLILSKVKPALKGYVTRWLSEIASGVYLGTLSLRVRERLWAKICKQLGTGGALMIFPAQTEQGYGLCMAGTLPYTFEDFEGLILAKRRISQ